MTLHQRRLSIALALIVLSWVSPAAGQVPSTSSPRPPDAADDARKWSFGVSVYEYLLPGDTDYVQPTISADRGWLHLEARYDYEDLKSGSFWFGRNFSGGDTVEWSVTPMVGGAVGRARGVAPGCKASVEWKRLQFYGEGEYFFDEHPPDRFWYSWSELSLSATPWFRAGVVEQRTWLHHADQEVNRGVLVGFTRGTWDVAAYVLNLTASRPAVVLAVSAGF